MKYTYVQHSLINYNVLSVASVAGNQHFGATEVFIVFFV